MSDHRARTLYILRCGDFDSCDRWKITDNLSDRKKSVKDVDLRVRICSIIVAGKQKQEKGDKCNRRTICVKILVAEKTEGQSRMAEWKNCKKVSGGKIDNYE